MVGREHVKLNAPADKNRMIMDQPFREWARLEPGRRCEG